MGHEQTFASGRAATKLPAVDSVNIQNNKILVKSVRGSMFGEVQKREKHSSRPLWRKSGLKNTTRNIPFFLRMPSFFSVTSGFLLLTLVSFTTAYPLKTEDELDSFLTQLRRLKETWSIAGLDSEDPVMEPELRQWLSSGLDRRRQLGDIEFSNRYAEFLRSKAKHTSMCAFLRRMQGVKKSGVAADTERVNLLLKQYMCPSIMPWPSDL